MSRVLLITGATGKQGGAVISALLAAKSDYRILAVTRDAASPSATKLAAKSPTISIIQGNLDDPVSLFAKAREVLKKEPVWGVFSVQAPPMNKTGSQVEERQGKSLVDAALENGVSFFVYSSVDRGGPTRSPENPTNIPHFISKHKIEKHLIEKTSSSRTTTTGTKKMGWTVLRPVAFMENFAPGFVGNVFGTAWRVGIPSGRPLQLIATEDIGLAAAAAFASPEEFDGKAVSLAGDELTHDQMREVFREKTGKDAPATWGVLAKFFLWISKEMGTMFEFFDKEGYGADIKEVKRMFPGTQSLGEWVEKREKKNV